MKDQDCKYCIYSRPVISENGIHYACCLSNKMQIECMCERGKHFFSRLLEEV